MKKATVGLLSLLLAVCLFVLPVQAQAAETSGTCGENLTWVLDEEGTLTISGTGEMKSFEYDGSDRPWHDYATEIKTVIIAEGVTSIGEYAFYSCTSLTGITIPDGVTSIARNAFDDCTSLISVTIPKGVTSIGEFAFCGCTSLISVTIPEGVTSIGVLAFNGCTSLTDVYYAGTEEQWDAILISTDNEPLTNTTIHFSTGAKRLASGTCGENLTWMLDGEGALTISGTGIMTDHYWDHYQEIITSVVIDKGATSIIDCAFRGCTNLTSVTIPDSITSIGMSAFADCTNLADISIPVSVTEILAGAFSNCTNLTSLVIPDSVTFIGSGVFRNCTSLTSIIIPDSVTKILDTAFSNCTSLTSIIVPEGVTSISGRAFYGCTSLTSVTIPEGVISIGNEAFDACTSLTDVYYDGTEEQWNAVEIDEGNEPLTNATVHFNTTAEVQTSGTCGENLTWVYDSETKTLTISGSGPMYDWSCGEDVPWYSCGSYYVVENEDGVTSVGDNAFSGCRTLRSVMIPDGVTSIGDYAFYGCSLFNVTIPERVVSIGIDAFHGSALKKFWVDNNNLYYSSDDWGVLFNKDKTLLIKAPRFAINGHYSIPDGVTIIDDHAFCYCDSLTSVTIPDSVTFIGSEAFALCDSLTSVTIPDSVTTIGFGAFYNCANLSVVRFEGDALRDAHIGYWAFYEVTANVYYPAGNETWTEDVMQDYGGTLTWIPEPTDPEPTDPEPTDPEPTNPEPTNPEPTEPALIENPFVDVPAEQYYYEPVQWAVENGITTGMSETTFAPDATCTRAQIVTFLWRANGSPAPTTSDNPFTDVPADQWYTDAVLWAVEQGITTGTSATTFSPDASCTRGQVATFLWRSEGQPAPGGANIFTDIAPGAYYYDAVLWAVENGITNGMGDGIFAPDATCTRGQIVTFLYRAMA